MTMDHDDIREALLAGEINAAVTAHLENCADCAALAAEIENIKRLAPSLETDVPPPPGLLRKIRARIAEERATRSSHRFPTSDPGIEGDGPPWSL